MLLLALWVPGGVGGLISRFVPTQRSFSPASLPIFRQPQDGGVIGSERVRVVLVTVDMLNHDREDAKVPGAEAT